jgi:DnaJ-class molecular chaperone
MTWSYDQQDNLSCDVCGGIGDVVCPPDVHTEPTDDDLCANCEGEGSTYCTHCGGGDATLAQGEMDMIPEGWYDDPLVAGAIRWWDGYRWVGPPVAVDSEVV